MARDLLAVTCGLRPATLLDYAVLDRWRMMEVADAARSAAGAAGTRTAGCFAMVFAMVAAAADCSLPQTKETGNLLMRCCCCIRARQCILRKDCRDSPWILV